MTTVTLEQNTNISVHAGIQTQPSVLASLARGTNNDHYLADIIK